MQEVVKIGKVVSPKQFSQLGVLTADGSGSMTDPAAGNISKAQSVNLAARELFTRFKVSRVKNDFSFAFVSFDTQATVRLSPTPAEHVDDNGDYDPLQGHGGGTDIYKALEEASRIGDEFLKSAPAGGVDHSFIVLLLTDGCCSDPNRTRQVATAMKQKFGKNLTIAGALFASLGGKDTAGEALLKDVVSDPVMYYKTVYDAETLRNFFIRSVSSSAGIGVA
jgi:Mg-chelatase subunit ChlD